LVDQAHSGALVKQSRDTVAAYLRAWLDGQHDLAPTSMERYRDIIERQTVPFIGGIELQKLRPVHVRDWLVKLRNAGCRGDRQLSAQSVACAYRVLRAALRTGVQLEVISRNVAEAVPSPKLDDKEVEILDAKQIATVLKALKADRIYPIVAVAIATGMRRGELLALQWRDVDLKRSLLSCERSLEETRAGLRFKGPKSKHGRRTISLPSSAVELLRQHQKAQLELRLRLGAGKPPADALVFCDYEGKPISPNHLSVMWRRAITPLDIPKVKFHALRHSHASALIHAGVDVVKVSRRLGHGSATITLNVYAHLFSKTDDSAAIAIETALGTL
jgi:integrase